MSFKIMTSKPKNNKFFITRSAGGYSLCVVGSPTDKTANVLANCVGFSCGRFNMIYSELTGYKGMKYPSLNCNAENFIEQAKRCGLKISKKPTLGGIMVWQKGATLSGNDGAGHVAVVEKINSSNSIYTSESGWGGPTFWNATRTNSNGRWGMNSAYKFRGCIINPAVKDEPTPTPAYTVGDYKTLTELNVRTGAGTNYRIKKVKELTADGKKHATSKNPNADAVYKKGTVFTALKIEKKGNDYWAKTPSGYICIQQGKNKYCKKV